MVGPAVDLVRRADLLDAALVHHHDPVGELERFLLVVGDEEARDAELVVQLAQPAAQLAAHARVERAERLVEQQHARLHRERARERDALALPAGELGRHAPREPLELDQVEQLVHARLDLRLLRAARAVLHAQAEGDVLEHVHVSEQRVVLEHEADPAVARAARGGVLAVERDRARVGVLEPGDQAQQGRLARARRAEQRDELAGLDVQRHVAQRGEVAEALPDLADFDAHGFVSRRICHSSTRLATRVTSASSASSVATANAAAVWYSL